MGHFSGCRCLRDTGVGAYARAESADLIGAAVHRDEDERARAWRALFALSAGEWRAGRTTSLSAWILDRDDPGEPADLSWSASNALLLLCLPAWGASTCGWPKLNCATAQGGARLPPHQCGPSSRPTPQREATHAPPGRRARVGSSGWLLLDLVAAASP